MRCALGYDWPEMSAQAFPNLVVPLEGAGPHDLSALLEAGLPTAQVALLKQIAEQAATRGDGFYLVGGLVRDLLLGKPGQDFDLVLEGQAIELARALQKEFGGQLALHKRFGTATWRIAEIKEPLSRQLRTVAKMHQLPDALDLISARAEQYAQPGALPEVKLAGMREDTQRRDFSINTLAVRLDGPRYGELVDFWDGVGDLRAGRLRVLHDRSFIDDPTRVLRILRFAGRFHFQIETHTSDLLQDGLPYLDAVSGERIRNELDQVFSEENAIEILSEMQRRGILEALHPQLRLDESGAAGLAHLGRRQHQAAWGLGETTGAELGYLLWLAPLGLETARAAAKRLRFEKALRDAVLQASQLFGELDGLKKADPSQVVARLEGISPLALYALYLGGADGETAQVIERYVRDWQHVQPKTDGHELRRRGLPPGPHYKDILARLRAAWLNGELDTEVDEEKMLKQLLDDASE